MMIVGTLLIVFGFVLVVMPLLIAFGIVPTLSGSAFGGQGAVGGTASHDVPRTTQAVRVQALRFSAVVGVLAIAGGAFFIYIDAQHEYDVQDEILANRKNITDLVAQPPAASPVVGRTVVAATPGPGLPTPVVNPNAGRDRFNQALALDKAGDNVAAIEQYKLAVASGGLDAKSKEAAQLEIGLLSLLLVKDGNKQGCPDARASLSALSTASSSVRQSANDALKETAKHCG